jgi:branched-chain amino acid transport system permease protein
MLDLPWGQLIVNGLALGSLYALTAFGIVLIYKTTDVINFAQGELAMFSTFIAFWLTTRMQMPFVLAFVLTLACAGALGVAVERIVIRPVTNASPLSPIIATVGLGLVLYGLAGWIWGYETRAFAAPVSGPPLRLANLVLSQINALILATVALLMVLLFGFFRYTTTGTAMRAVAQNRLAARLMGINVNRINALGWGLGAALGAVTGILIAPLNYLDPGMMGDVALKAFAAAVLGGVRSLPGAVVGGLLLGIMDSVVGFQYPDLRTTIAFALIVLVLVVWPGGLLGQQEIKKV